MKDCSQFCFTRTLPAPGERWPKSTNIRLSAALGLMGLQRLVAKRCPTQIVAEKLS